ncbi:unnamed protein product [Notodromas monacha]|uniref:Secreted protein n=1 Tax=Notodromas monacha TaxID=399045 RepID=A0A7R9GK74_9CRUS|nr:unnamed protein product [Notodromas monacha]CAG0925605.1 unnamed protein product [Notodromas monacha]
MRMRYEVVLVVGILGFLSARTKARNSLCPYDTTITTVPELLRYLSHRGDLLNWIFGDLRYVGNLTRMDAAPDALAACYGECMACSTTLFFLRR